MSRKLETPRFNIATGDDEAPSEADQGVGVWGEVWWEVWGRGEVVLVSGVVCGGVAGWKWCVEFHV